MKKEQSYPIGDMLKPLLKNAAVQNKSIFYSLTFYTLVAAVYPFLAVLLPKFLITELVRGEEADLSVIFYIVIIYFILAGLFGFFKVFLHDCAYPKLTALRIDYVRDTFDKLVSIDYKYMEDANFYENHQRALEATSSNSNGVERVYHELFELPAIVLTILVLMVFIGQLNIFIMLGLILNLAAVTWIERSVHNFEYKKKEEIAHAERKKGYYYRTTHDFSFGKDIRLFDFKARILKNYDKEINSYTSIYKSIYSHRYKLGFVGLLALLISNGLTYGILIYKVLNGMSIADFSMYLAATVTMSALLVTASEKIATVINEGQYVYDYYQFINGNYGDKGGERQAVSGDTLEVVFDNVSFKYPGTEKYIFKNLNFTIPKGQRLAIVGINGAGKSTLVKLMTGLFDVTEGEIRINGVPLKEYSKKALFSMFSVVFQEVNILAYTVRENVACTSENINEERVQEALKRVGLWEKIKGLKKGLDQTMLKVIDEQGVEFSGGESQKLAIARALYKDGNMVIMDEPTAALDALAEAEIYEQFSELVKGKTSVYISHRLASTKFCDKIALFDKDGLKEYGNHEELMAKGGDYYNMFTVQGKYYSEEGIENE